MESSGGNSHQKQCEQTYKQEVQNWCSQLIDYDKEACVSGLYFNMENCVLYKK